MTNTNQTIPPFGSQQHIDWVNLRYHELIAGLLRTEPERVLSQARTNLTRWLAAYEPGESAAACLREWADLLDRHTVAELSGIIVRDSDEGQRLRSSTPFIGILSAEERAAIRRFCEERALL